MHAQERLTAAAAAAVSVSVTAARKRSQHPTQALGGLRRPAAAAPQHLDALAHQLDRPGLDEQLLLLLFVVVVQTGVRRPEAAPPL
jgi:hypothetical protein